MRIGPKAFWSLLIALAILRAGDAADSHRQSAQPSAQNQPASPLAITHGPYLQLPSDTSMTIVWHTNKKCVSKVEYGAGETLDRTAVSGHSGLIDNDRTSHIIRLTGLRPGTTYRYRLVSREFGGYQKQHIVTYGDSVSSLVYRFTTLDPAKERFSFSVVSDIHERAGDLEAALKQSSFQGIDFAVFNGDMLNDFMQGDQAFTGFLNVSVRMFAKELPFLFVRGNHEVRGRFARSLPDYFPTLDGQAYYSFNHGGVHFIVLDSGEDKEDSHEYYNGLVDFQNYRKEQAAWLNGDLESDACRKARYRIVFSHIPPRGADGFAIQEVRRNFELLLNQAGIDLWLSGHTHRFQRIGAVAGQNEYPLIIGATDTITRVNVYPDRLEASVVNKSGEELLPPTRMQRLRNALAR